MSTRVLVSERVSPCVPLFPKKVNSKRPEIATPGRERGNGAANCKAARVIFFGFRSLGVAVAAPVVSHRDDEPGCDVWCGKAFRVVVVGCCFTLHKG